MDTYLKCIADHLRDNGFYVIPKERIRTCYSAHSVLREELEMINARGPDFLDYIKRRTVMALARELEPAVYWERRDLDDALGPRTEFTARLDVVMPKEKE